jgi:hypothetical protein
MAQRNPIAIFDRIIELVDPIDMICATRWALAKCTVLF